MGQTVHHKLIVRLAALAAVTFSLILVLRQDGQVGFSMGQPMPTFQDQAPIIVAHNEPNSPLVISAERQLAKTDQAPELAFNVTNVTSKTITAFAIKLEVISDSKVASTVSLYNLEFSSRDLSPNRSLSEFATYDNLSKSQHRVTLSVDYVEFSGGNGWGLDSAKSAERVAGQRAATDAVATRVIRIIREGNTNDFVNTLESMASIDPPAQYSEEWKDGFRLATGAVVQRLKRAHQLGGLVRVNNELSRFATRLSGDH